MASDLEEMEKSLWKQCDDMCKKIKEVEPLCKQFKKYVKLLRDDRATYQLQCFGQKKQIDELEKRKSKPHDLQRKESEREKEKTATKEIIKDKSDVDLVSVIKFLERLENGHVQLTLKLQKTVEKLNERTSTSEQNIEKCMKETQATKKDIDNVNQQMQRWARLSNEEMQHLKREKERLQSELQVKENKIKELKEELEKTKKKLDETKRQMENEKAAANAMQVAGTTMIEKADPTDRQRGQTYNEEIMNKIRFTFVQYVIPPDVLHFFQKYDTGILTRGDIEFIDSVTINYGPSRGAGVLLGLLSRYKNWYPCLLKVLRDPKVKMGHAADQMEADLRGAVTQPQEPEQSHEAALTPCRSRGSFDIVCAVQEADLKLMMSSCENVKQHGQVIRVEDFHENHLTQMDDDGHIGNMLVKAFDLVVRIEILETNSTSSPSLRPKTPTHDAEVRRIGSGMVWDVYKRHSDYSVPCSCLDCQRSHDPKIKWAEFGVLTAMGLMQYDPQCKQTVCHLSYKDPRGRQARSVLTAVKLKDYEQHNDKGYCELSCITHDQTLAENLANIVAKWKLSRAEAKGNIASGDTRERCAVVSYPHALDKSVSLGQFVRTDTDTSGHPKRDVYEAVTCDGCTGAPVFFYRNGVFTGQTVHNGKNAFGENQSIEYRGNGRFD